MQEQTTQGTSLRTNGNERTGQQLQFTPFGFLSGLGVEHFHCDTKALLECHLESVQIKKDSSEKLLYSRCWKKRENSLSMKEQC